MIARTIVTSAFSDRTEFSVSTAHDDQVDTWSQAAARFRGFYTGIMDYYRAAALVEDAGKTSETPAELVN